MNKPLQATNTESDRLSYLLDLVFADALRMAEKEEQYELCGMLYSFIKELK